jgi:hypothetical protein
VPALRKPSPIGAAAAMPAPRATALVRDAGNFCGAPKFFQKSAFTAGWSRCASIDPRMAQHHAALRQGAVAVITSFDATQTHRPIAPGDPAPVPPTEPMPQPSPRPEPDDDPPPPARALREDLDALVDTLLTVED